MKLKITFTVGNRSCSEVLEGSNLEDLREHFEECRSNGLNPWLEQMTFEHYCRPIQTDGSLKSLNFFNQKDGNHHMIYGYVESFGQADISPANWLYEDYSSGHTTDIVVEWL